MGSEIRFLMCPPDYFEVNYVINPWMEGNLHQAKPDLARTQWQTLVDLLSQWATIEILPAQPDWPDLVFTANGGLVVGQTMILSRFLSPQRQGEEALFQEWFCHHDYTLYQLPPELPFEGAGDALMDRQGRWLWAGYGFRSVLDCHVYLAEWLDLEVLSLRLIDPRFYHLDTCFCPLTGGYLLYYPPAFDVASNQVIERRVPASKRIVVGETDAINFACNAINIDRTIILNQASQSLTDQLAALGFEVIETSLSEFIKAGGAAKCLTLRLTEPISFDHHPQTALHQRMITLEGHLLDTDLLNRVLDLIVTGGGSFKITDFQLGEQRQSSSRAQIQISAPSLDSMGKIMAQAIALGAFSPPQDICDNPLETVTQAGVAPDDFYVTTIYPTEVRVHCQWVRVQNQRMDAAIVVQDTPRGPLAVCRLLRDLQVGDRVVVGVDGIRTLHPAEGDTPPQNPTEFTFMGTGISSERRVELVVEQIAWQLHRLRQQGGKVVVVAGPVVIHTGGSDHLAKLVRQGYVQALLGGNAIAVHDIEHALLGTSLGMDLQSGIPVRGGHRHHLRAINTIRDCGSIAQAVEQGVLTQGILYECVINDVPFSLAGSIRDDGPLPDTEMNLIQAQADYNRLLQGADLILMLASMLHSIGVGNMTPAGVKLVCVDINPAVVTKLSDRGSLDSIGVVTDVGLFLSLLVQQLTKLDNGMHLSPLAR